MAESDLKAVVVQAFQAASGDYERIGPEFFNLFGRTLVEKADIRPGMRVLDVGCGTGAALIPAADIAGPTGHVLGIDLAAGMIDRVNHVISERGWDHAVTRLGDAEDPPVSAGDWDRVLAAQVLFLLPAPGRAVACYQRLLKPGGILAFSTWGPDNPACAPVYKALFSQIPEGSVPKLMPSREVFSSDDRISALLETSGFVDIQHEMITYNVVYADVEQWLAWSRSHGGRAFWDAIPQELVATAGANTVAVLEELCAPDGSLRITTSVRYTVAVRP